MKIREKSQLLLSLGGVLAFSFCLLICEGQGAQISVVKDTESGSGGLSRIQKRSLTNDDPECRKKRSLTSDSCGDKPEKKKKNRGSSDDDDSGSNKRKKNRDDSDNEGGDRKKGAVDGKYTEVFTKISDKQNDMVKQTVDNQWKKKAKEGHEIQVKGENIRRQEVAQYHQVEAMEDKAVMKAIDEVGDGNDKMGEMMSDGKGDDDEDDGASKKNKKRKNKKKRKCRPKKNDDDDEENSPPPPPPPSKGRTARKKQPPPKSEEQEQRSLTKDDEPTPPTPTGRRRRKRASKYDEDCDEVAPPPPPPPPPPSKGRSTKKRPPPPPPEEQEQRSLTKDDVTEKP